MSFDKKDNNLIETFNRGGGIRFSFSLAYKLYSALLKYNLLKI